MHCYDCYEEGVESVAVAVCVECGAGACPRHLHRDPEPVRRSSATGRVWSAHDARRMTCLVCHESLHPDGR
ncbi:MULTISPECIES: DUF2180 family protein [Streptomyces]|uniref:DUF2180 family protein n=1 Tax=Streptomyces TaxID=1883 RepID=UPI00034E1EF1|nr:MULTISPECIES: DUF2180 family protein [Streptomyces]EPD93118.1 hypothetical protein HMPREF1486_04195 [Streptomyces sp. HPH0547]MDI6411699.1 DUF2180 family protein [Streptomyces albus]QID39208.1 DUF2180 family protein [Streptomyces albus]GHJ18686.1 hypothetical protein TPA0909_03000 [Streptomyces albus]